MLPVHHRKSIKSAVTIILCVSLDIEIEISFPKESSILDHVHKAGHYIIIVLVTSVVNKDNNFRNLMVLTL